MRVRTRNNCYEYNNGGKSLKTKLNGGREGRKAQKNPPNRFCLYKNLS